ncbi:activating signal cointegrator 1 complex subunit 2 homolog isoform X2 [Ostrinia furnacalis]|uniref:activating signal cointegrator 1 complex subunit 2 homolog isoform X2 n=1 Tax=Ostrinia furnacalis TaxID=93504 RepID=UPI00103F4336|nr:activating signal cointegrator 1 complex subunit 2 homolog isoform X2 [Ostrinia furnacalis]
MLRLCVSIAILGCTLARPQHQYQQGVEGIPPHLLRQYIGQQQQAQQTQVIPRPAAAAAPARLPYSAQSEGQYQHQYQPQPQYQAQPAPQPQPQPQYRPQYQPQRQQEQREPEDYDPHPSYQFGFDVNDDQYTNYQNRKEQRDGDVIKGSYSVVDSDGFVRTVTYTADPKEGFRAEVSRQPTDIVVKIPTPKPQFQQPQVHQPQVHQPQPQHQPQQAHRQQAPPQYYRYEQQ